MKIYTKTGDSGDTGLFRGGRVGKDDPRIEAYGTVDELNASLGLARVAEPGGPLDELLARIQNELFDLGAELATPDPADQGAAPISTAHIGALERAIDKHEADLPPLKTFILPGGTPPAAALHLARTVCRRAERRVVTLARQPGARISPHAVVYLNRLGDLLFVLARAANHAKGRDDEPWRPGGERG
jgi:cob(I)alamin adenosyltransferase